MLSWLLQWQVCFQEFQEFWAEYDDGSGTIAPEQLQTLLIRTDPPLGLGRMATGRDVLKFVFNLDIPLVNGRVPFHRTVYELVRNVSETQIPEVTVHTVTSASQENFSETGSAGLIDITSAKLDSRNPQDQKSMLSSYVHIAGNCLSMQGIQHVLTHICRYIGNIDQSQGQYKCALAVKQGSTVT